MDKWSKIRSKLVDAQEELYKIDDEYRQSKNELDTKWNFLGDFYRGLDQKFDEKHSIVLSAYSKMPDAAVETIRRYRMVNEDEFKTLGYAFLVGLLNDDNKENQNEGNE